MATARIANAPAARVAALAASALTVSALVAMGLVGTTFGDRAAALRAAGTAELGALPWRAPALAQDRIDRLERLSALRIGSARSRVLDGARPQASAAGVELREGAFVSYRRRVFRVVGGAPLYVSSWSLFGGPKPVQVLTDSQFAALEGFPADGSFIRTAPDRRVYRFVGGAPLYVSTWQAFGGTPQPATLVDRIVLDNADAGAFPFGYVSPLALDLVATSDDRLLLDSRIFVRGGQTGRVYKLLGGSPRYIPSWAPYGGPKPTITVDQITIARAGEGTGPFRFLLQYPLDGWPVGLAGTPHLFVMAGGAPIYVATPALAHTWYGALVAPKVGQALLNGLRVVPADGTQLVGLPTLPSDPGELDSVLVKSYAVLDGVPLLQGESTFADLDDEPGGVPVVFVDQVAIDRAGTGGLFNHLIAPPPTTTTTTETTSETTTETTSQTTVPTTLVG